MNLGMPGALKSIWPWLAVKAEYKIIPSLEDKTIFN